MSDEYAPWPSPLYRDLAEELLRMGRRKVTVYRDAVLDQSAFAILWVLSDDLPRTLRELTEALDLEQSTVNRQVNAAIKAGYLERYDVPESVSRLIRPTTAGREAFHHDGLLRAGRLERVLSDLDPGNPQTLLRELRAFNDAYERAVRAESEPTRVTN